MGEGKGKPWVEGVQGHSCLRCTSSAPYSQCNHKGSSLLNRAISIPFTADLRLGTYYNTQIIVLHIGLMAAKLCFIDLHEGVKFHTF